MNEQESNILMRHRDAMMRWEIFRYRLATISVIFIGSAAVLLAVYAFSASKEIQWQVVTLAAIGALCFALPFFKKIDLKKDGGGAEFGSPLEQIRAMLEEQDKKAEAARTEMQKQTNQQVGQLAAQLEERQVSASSAKVQADKTIPKEPTLRDIEQTLPSVTNPEDQQAGRFGGKEENNGRRIVARTRKSAVNKDWVIVDLRVESTDGTPLKGRYVYFFVHETFSPDAYRIATDKSGNAAEIELSTYGAFTAGAVADQGKTKLEIDLATSKSLDAPSWWRKR